MPPVRPSGEYVARIWPFSRAYLHFIVWCGILDFYFEEIGVFQAGSRRAQLSME